jgi:hypothetical protein
MIIIRNDCMSQPLLCSGLHQGLTVLSDVPTYNRAYVATVRCLHRYAEGMSPINGPSEGILG